MKIITVLFLLLLLTISSASDESLKGAQWSFADRAELTNKSKHIVCPADDCVKDDDFYTVQIFLAKDGDKTPSFVTDDGQIVFVNAAYKTDAKALLELSLERRLARLPAT